jgi:hypothetical protein
MSTNERNARCSFHLFDFNIDRNDVDDLNVNAFRFALSTNDEPSPMFTACFTCVLFVIVIGKKSSRTVRLLVNRQRLFPCRLSPSVLCSYDQQAFHLAIVDHVDRALIHFLSEELLHGHC